MASIIDGRATARAIQDELQAEVAALVRTKGISPGLTVILVGDDPASRTYVSSKAKMCGKLGIHSQVETLPAASPAKDVLELVDRANADPDTHGILVQLPLPTQIRAAEVIERIHPAKDVDGLHPFNVGLLCAGRPRFIPCTPLGVCELLVRHQVPISGREVVVLGRSNLVGRPLSVLMSGKGPFGDATVTVCHSRSSDLAGICRRADILVVAIGQRKFVTAEMVKPGAVVIDVGIHPSLDPAGSMCGDVDFESVSRVASQITPVPGGVGPMTIAMLMRNTVHAAKLQGP